MWPEIQFILEFMFRLESVMAGALWITAALIIVVPVLWLHEWTTRNTLQRFNPSTPIRRNYGAGHAE